MIDDQSAGELCNPCLEGLGIAQHADFGPASLEYTLQQVVAGLDVMDVVAQDLPDVRVIALIEQSVRGCVALLGIHDKLIIARQRCWSGHSLPSSSVRPALCVAVVMMGVGFRRDTHVCSYVVLWMRLSLMPINGALTVGISWGRLQQEQ